MINKKRKKSTVIESFNNKNLITKNSVSKIKGGAQLYSGGDLLTELVDSGF